ncbi:MAG: hypothetical protein ACFB02_16595 [Mastigocoleus sp.]
MFNFKGNFYKIVLGLIIIPIGVSAAISDKCKDNNCNFSTYNPEFNHQKIAQNRSNWLSFIWRKRPKRPLGSRSLKVCAVAPGLIETLEVWSDRPLFLWQGKVSDQQTTLKVRQRDDQRPDGNTNLWEQKVNLTDKKISYQGKTPLKPGKTYEWQLEGITPWITFQIMPKSDRQKIQTDLQKLEKKLTKSSNPSEEMALHKASYFLNDSPNLQKSKRAWADALQALYEVEKPSKSFVEKRQKFMENICTQQTANSPE